MKKFVLSLLGVLLIGILAGYGISWLLQQPGKKQQEVKVAVQEELPGREVLLYFTDPSGAYLVPEYRNIAGCELESDCVRGLIQELVTGPRQGGIAVLPKETKVLDVGIENDLVRVDFSRQLVDLHPGGSLTELLTVYSLANSLNENFPYLRQLQILVDGQIRQTLKGHVRIDQPVYADFSFGQPPELGGETPAPGKDTAEKGELSIDQLIQDAESGKGKAQ